MNTRAIFFLFLAFAALFAPDAFAQSTTSSSGMFDLASDDLSKTLFLDHIFGPIDGSGASSGLTGAIGIFNSVVLFVGGILAAYTIVAGTMQTAQDGEMLGKKWSSMWIPIRMSLGTAMLLPVMNGWCVAQAVVIWLAMQGMGAANAVWNQYTANPVEAALFMPPNVVPQVTKLANAMLLSNVCVASLNNSVQDSIAASTLSLVTDLSFSAQQISNASTFGYNYTADGNGVLAGANLCGGVTMPLPKDPSSLTVGTASAQSLVDMPKVQASLDKVHESALVAMQAAIQPLAQEIAANDTTVTANEVHRGINAAANAYAAALEAAGTAAYQSALANNQAAADMRKDGWVNIGSYYSTIAAAGDEVSNAMGNIPTAAGATNNVKMSIIGVFVGNMHDAMSRAQNLIDDGNATASDGMGIQALSGAQDGLSAQMLSWFIQDKNLGFGSDAGALIAANPVIGAKNLGNKLITSAWSALGAGTAFAAVGGVVAGNAAGKVTGADTAFAAGLSLLSAPFFMLFGTLLLAGVGLAVIVPMIPYLMWMGLVLSWVILLIESTVAVPLWMLAHIHPDGDGVAGKGGQGYMLLLSLTLRPSLAVIGFICSIELMKPIGVLINSTFAAAANLNVLSNGGAGVTAVVALMVLYSGFMTMIIKKVFTLQHAIPDNVLAWLGGGTGNLMGTGAAVGMPAGDKAPAVVAGALKVGGGGVAGMGKAMGSGGKGGGGEGGGAGGGKASIERGDMLNSGAGTGGARGGSSAAAATGGKEAGAAWEDASTLSAARAAGKTPGGASGRGGASGELLEHGPAPYKHDPDESANYYAKVRDENGGEKEVWGKDLGRAINESGAQIGDNVNLERTGADEAVSVNANVRDDAGAVVGKENISATRKGWQATVSGPATE